MYDNKETDYSPSGEQHNATRVADNGDDDVFGDESYHQIHYKTLSWQTVAAMMIAEIVSNGMLSLPSSLAVVGMVPGVIIIVFLGVFATFTSYLLIQFKVHHPEVHSMGDAGYILFGAVGREILSWGTVIFAVFGTGGQLLAGQIALAVLSDNRLCLMLYTGVFAIPTLLFALPRSLDGLTWPSIASAICILAAGFVGMIGAGINPSGVPISIALPSDFVTAFISITNPVFAYAGHFMFFILISEMRNPKDAMKAAYALQIFATSFYTVFAIVTYYYLGPQVLSPSFSSLPFPWNKATYGIALLNFLIAGSLYSHTAAKLLFVRIFRRSHHLHSHTLLGWSVWTALVVIMVGVAFVLAIGVPIFNYLIGIAASLFASWYTYGIAGAFWIHDAWIGLGAAGLATYGIGARGTDGLRRRPLMFTLCVLTLLAGAFICVAGLYAIIDAIVLAYQAGQIGQPFSC